MPATLTPIKTIVKLSIDSGNGNLDNLPPDGDGGGDSGGGSELTPPLEGYRIGIWLAVASITMMFLALTSAYILNQAYHRPLDLPSMFLVSTVIILASSVTFEISRRALRQRYEVIFMRWLCVTMILGLTFLCVQSFAWRQLVAHGFYVNTNLHSGYAYIFTGLHAVHLLGGILALSYVIYKSRRGLWTALRRRVSVDATALYWHFLDGLWLYLLAILFIWG